MASVFAHELVEVVSDPFPDDPSWMSNSGYENADLCQVNIVFELILVGLWSL